MFRLFKDTTSNVLNAFSSSLSWILSNKKAIAVFALIMISGEAKSASYKRTIVQFECGSFEVIGSGNPSKEPIRFMRDLGNNEGVKKCVSYDSLTYCEPPTRFDKNDIQQIYLSSQEFTDNPCSVIQSISSSRRNA